jgi:hypothetical protein
MYTEHTQHRCGQNTANNLLDLSNMSLKDGDVHWQEKLYLCLTKRHAMKAYGGLEA